MLDMKNMLPYDVFERMHPYGVTTRNCHVEVDEDTWFFVETYDPATTEWKEVKLNFCNPKEVAQWIKKYYGWKEAAYFKRLARSREF